MKLKPRRHFRFLAGVSHRARFGHCTLGSAMGSGHAVIALLGRPRGLVERDAGKSARRTTHAQMKVHAEAAEPRHLPLNLLLPRLRLLIAHIFGYFIWLIFVVFFFWPFSHFEFGLQIAAHFHFTQFLSFHLLSCFLLASCSCTTNFCAISSSEIALIVEILQGGGRRYLADFSSIGQIICLQMRNLAQRCLFN